ncbi:anti-sigma regulatory factor [candidate division KSB1 bacterium]|nr:anti-sigma regulatory factor [candidate division KSB1 bacterium]
MAADNTFIQEYSIRGWDFTRAGEASCQIKNILKQIGVSQDVIRRVAIASYEAEMNVVMYARQGTIRCEIDTGKIKITIEDEGPGIADIDQAMQEGFSTATPEMREMGFGAGMGLPNIKRNADECEITSVVGLGTKLIMSFNL